MEALIDVFIDVYVLPTWVEGEEAYKCR